MTAQPHGIQACETMHLLIQADVDQELDAAAAAGVAAHLHGCADCARLHARLHALSGAMRTGLDRHAAPPALRAVLAERGRAPGGRRTAWSHAAAFGAGLALAASLVAVMLPRAPAADLLGESVAAHIRALQPGHLVDVASSDRHTVKPWFDGRLDYAPPVHDFAARGFALVGGRLDYMADRPVAALVYRHDKHLIDVFVWPASARSVDGAIRGYNVVAWTQSGLSWRAVSDLNTAELTGFAAMLRTEPP